jgi:hypothetical protein
VVGTAVLLSSMMPMDICCWLAAVLLVLVVCAMPQVINHCYYSMFNKRCDINAARGVKRCCLVLQQQQQQMATAGRW